MSDQKLTPAPSLLIHPDPQAGGLTTRVVGIDEHGQEVSGIQSQGAHQFSRAGKGDESEAIAGIHLDQ